MASITTYECSAWLVEDEEFNNGASSSTEEPVFLIQIYSDLTPEADSTIQENTPTIFKQFQVNRDYLLHDTSSWQTLVNMFEETDIPYNVHSIMIYRVINCARENRNMDRKIIPLVVHIRTLEITSFNAAFMESFDSQSSRFVGATKSAIQALEKVKIIQDFSENCVICLQDFEIGTEASRLRCLHTYHGNCIAKWLEISNICPLCRFQLSSS